MWVLRSRGCNIHYLRKILVFFGGETQFRDFISRWKELGLRFSANLKPFIGSLYFLAHQSLQKGKFERDEKTKTKTDAIGNTTKTAYHMWVSDGVFRCRRDLLQIDTLNALLQS